MITRLPSNQRQYDAYWSRDSAFVQLPADATDEQREAHTRKWSVARETGDYSGLAIEGATPTKFVMRAIPGEIVRKLIDRQLAGAIGNLEASAVAFRAALVDVVNFGDAKVKMVRDEVYGTLADAEIANVLDECALGCVTELGGAAFARSFELSGK